MTTTPTIVTVPCFSGAPWDLDQLTPLADHDLTTMRLPDDPDDIEAYADVVALAFATGRPSGLRALVLSGGFASDPVDDPVTRAKVAMARFLPGPLYRQIVLRFLMAEGLVEFVAQLDEVGEFATDRAVGPELSLAALQAVQHPVQRLAYVVVQRRPPAAVRGPRPAAGPGTGSERGGDAG